jgi:tetratricopeptide (TPR) repeat protein
MIKKQILYSMVVIFCIVFMSSCQSTNPSIKSKSLVKTINPHAPFVDDSIQVIDERATNGVERSADAAAKTAQLPVSFYKKFTNSLQGVSDKNPYARPEPYFRKDFKQDMLVADNKGIIQPQYQRGENYSRAYRAPFVFDEMTSRNVNEMVEANQISSNQSAQQYFSFQQSLEADLVKAESLYKEGKFSEALEIVDKVLSFDSSSQQARILFEQCIKGRETSRIQQEALLKEKIEKDEKISQYLKDARCALNQQKYQEATRIAKKALSIAPTNAAAIELTDTIELAQFEDGLKKEGVSSSEILERLIYEHLNLYKQYTDEKLSDLAKKELQKVSILESYKDKLGSLK